MPTRPTIAPVSSIERVEVRQLSLPTRRSLTASHDAEPAAGRHLVVVGVEDGDGTIGWGECSALNAATYTSEWAADSFDRLSGWAEGGPHPDPASHPMTCAAIEMALIDLALRAHGQSLASSIQAHQSTVRAGATIGLAPTEPSVDLARQLVDAGYRKLKVKIDPHQVDDVAHALTHVFEHGNEAIEIHVDANGSLGEAHLMALLGLTWHGVTAIEQPFPTDRPDLAVELMLGSDVIVVADEAVTTIADAQALLDARALRAVAIKPARVGGVQAALGLLAWCEATGVGASVGGMLECGLGRHALAAIGALDGFTITGDLSPASQWLAADPWPDIEMVGPDIVVPTTVGVAPPPDQLVLDQVTTRRVEHRRPRLVPPPLAG